VSVGFLGLLHAQLEGEAGERFLWGDLGRLPDKPSFEEWRAANGRHVGRSANFAPVQTTSRGASGYRGPARGGVSDEPRASRENTRAGCS